MSNLIVARMEPADAGAVAGIFAESDRTELPALFGVTRRTLFRFHDVYLHLVETEDDITGNLHRAKTNPLFRDISAKLDTYIRPYRQDWAKPEDALAQPFYQWSQA